jgi:hypothetical protein
MFNLNSLVQKAQSLIDPALSPLSSERRPSKATLFRHQFRLPDSETPLTEITAELSLTLPLRSSGIIESSSEKEHETHGNIYAGKLHLSDNFLCFSTQATSFQSAASLQSSIAFTGQTYGAGPAGNGFTLPLCAIKKVERLHTQNSLFALAITTWNGGLGSSSDTIVKVDTQRFTLQLAGSRQQCDHFCDGLKKGLRSGVKQIDSLKTVVNQCYSEYLLSGVLRNQKDDSNASTIQREAPDTGLGSMFRYPGDPKKLRDRSKMRLWMEYLKGETIYLVAKNWLMHKRRKWP